MKKTTVVVGVIALAGIAYVGSSWYVGKEAQQAIADGVDQANARVVKMLGPDLTGTRFSIEIRDYQRGVFTSTAQYVIRTVDSDGQPMEYVLQDNLQHGPFPPAALREGKFAPVLAYSQAQMVVTPAVQEWFDAQQGQTPLRIDTQVGFGGQGTSVWTFAPVEISRAERRVSFSGGHVRVDFTDGFNNNVANGHFDVYALTDSMTGEKVEVRDISLRSATEMTGTRQFDHQSAAQVRTLTVSGDADTQPIAIDGLDVKLSSTQAEGFLDAQLRYDAAHILVDGVDLGQMTAAGAVAKLNMDALTDLQQTYAAMAEQRGPDTEPGFLLTEEEQLLLQDKLRPVLAAGPTVSLEPVFWKNSSGQSQASAFIALRDPGRLDTANAMHALRELVANARLELAVDRAMVVELFQHAGAAEGDRTQAGEFGGQLFDEYADLLTQLGLARLIDNTLSLSLDASPAEDRIILNGETMTTEQLMMLALGLLFLQ